MRSWCSFLPTNTATAWSMQETVKAKAGRLSLGRDGGDASARPVTPVTVLRPRLPYFPYIDRDVNP